MFHAFMLLLFFTTSNVLSLGCFKCDEAKCKEDIECEGGLVKDICNCCDVCAKQEGDKCGGLWGLLGKCDEGLYCKATEVVKYHSKGICEAKENYSAFKKGNCKYIAACRKACRYGFKPPRKGSCIACDCHKRPKRLLESCGGKYNMNGVCGENLKCIKNICKAL